MRVAIYARVSTQHQVQAQTIEQQLERLMVYIKQQGWELPQENIFRDDGISGASLNRPGLDRLRDQVVARLNFWIVRSARIRTTSWSCRFGEPLQNMNAP